MSATRNFGRELLLATAIVACALEDPRCTDPLDTTLVGGEPPELPSPPPKLTDEYVTQLALDARNQLRAFLGLSTFDTAEESDRSRAMSHLLAERRRRCRNEGVLSKAMVTRFALQAELNCGSVVGSA